MRFFKKGEKLLGHDCYIMIVILHVIFDWLCSYKYCDIYCDIFVGEITYGILIAWFCKIDKRGILLIQTISYLFVNLQNILLLTFTTRMCREIVWKTGIPEGFVGGRSELRSTKL